MLKSNLLKHSHTLTAIGCGLVLSTGMFVSQANAYVWDQMTRLTVNQPIQIEDTVLQPGKYVIRIADNDANRFTLQIYNGDMTHLYGDVLAMPAQRLAPTEKTSLVFWETPSGTAPALRYWYHPGRNFGEEFSRPQHPYQIQQVAQNTTPTPAPAPAVVSQPPVQEHEAHPAGPASEQAAVPQQPVEIAQNTPPAPQSTNPDSDTPFPAQTANQEPEHHGPQTLPHTASPYPLFGLMGFVSLGLLGFVRRPSRSTVENKQVEN